jgi:hypothetical protein
MRPVCPTFSVPPLGRRPAPGAAIWIRALLQMLPDGRGQVGGQARLGQVLVDARGQRLLARAVEGVAGQREHGNALGDPVRLESPRHFPSVHDGEAEVEDDDVGLERL